MRHRRCNHMHQIGLVPGRHDGKPRQVGKKADVERAGMGCAVLPDKTGTVDGKNVNWMEKVTDEQYEAR